MHKFKLQTYQILKSNIVHILWISIILICSDISICQSISHFDRNSSLISDRVNALCLDQKNILWIGTDKGLQVFDRNNLNPKRLFKNGSIHGMQLPFVKIQCIEEDKNGKLWIGSNEGLSILDLEELQLNKISMLEGLKTNIEKIKFDEDGGAYLKHQYELSYLNTNSTLSAIPLDARILFDMEMGSDGILYIWAEDQNLQKQVITIDPNRIIDYHTLTKSSFLDHKSWEANKPWILNYQNQFNLRRGLLFKDKSGNMILKGIKSQSFFRIDKNRDTVIQELSEEESLFDVSFHKDLESKNIEINSNIYEIDSRHNYIGSSNGLYLLKESNAAIIKNTDNKSYRNLIELEDGTKVFSHYSGLEKFDINNNKIAESPIYSALLSHLVLENGEILAGIDKDGLVLLNSSDLTIKKTNITDLYYVTDLLRVDPNYFFIAHDKGLAYAKYHSTQDSTFIEIIDEFLEDEAIHTLLLKETNSLLVGAEKGLFQLDNYPNNTKKEHIKLEDNCRNVSIIFEDKVKNRYWLGTKTDGVFIINENYKVINRINNYQDFIDNRITSIARLSDSIIAIGTFEEILHVDLDGNIISTFLIPSLTDVEELNRYSVLKGKDNNIYYGSSNGVVLQEIKEVPTKKNHQDVFIYSVNLINEKESADTIIYNFNKTLNRVVLPATNTNIEFTILNSPPSGAMTYLYRLKGIEEEWIEGSASKIKYANIPSGNYDFQIRLPTSEKTHSINLIKPMLFYRSVWFYTFLGFVGLSLLLSIIYQKVASKKQLKEIKQNISADLHDDLGYVLSKVNRKIESLKKNTNKSDLSDQLNDISKNVKEGITRLSRIVWIMDDEDKSIFEIYYAIANIFEEVLEAQTKFIHFINTDINSDEILFDQKTSRSLIIVTKEAAHNIIKHTESDKVEVKLSHSKSTFMLEVVNTFRKVKNPINITNRGLNNMERRISEIDGKIEFIKTESSFTIRITIRN